MLRRAVLARSSIVLLPLLILACAVTAGDPRSSEWSADSLIGTPSDDGSAEANIVVAIERADQTGPACSGVLLTPTVVLTARPCVDPVKVGRFPVVRVGPTYAGAIRYFSSRLPHIQPGAPAGSPGSVDFDGQLALISLNPNKPVLDGIVAGLNIPHPQLLAPTGSDEPTADGAWTYTNIGVSGWSNTGVTPQESSNRRQSAVFSQAALFFNTDAPNGHHPFWLRSTAGQAVKLTDIDLGGALFIKKANNERQVFGIAIQTGAKPAQISSGACPASAPSCDVWVDITAEPNASWIRSNVQIAKVSSGPRKNARWFEQHPRAIVRGDGTPDWWQGEVDYTGPCQPGKDADCDHWYDSNVNPADASLPWNRDNCQGWWNPAQSDADDDGYGNVCDNCPSFSNYLQRDTSTEFVNKTRGNVVPPSGRVAEINEVSSAVYPGDGCRSWLAYEEQRHNFSFGQIWANHANDAWAIGADSLFHWDGTDWAAGVPKSPVRALWAAAPNDVWGVGGSDAISHYDGAAWSVTTVPGAMLDSISGTGPKDVWAHGRTYPELGHLVHWDGTSWTVVDRPNFVSRMWAAGPQDVWAIGYGPDGQVIIARWSNNQWTDYPSTSAPYSTLYAIHGSGPDNIWISAVAHTSGQGVTLRWNGASWSEISVPGGALLRQLSARGPNDVWGVSDDGALWYWNGTVWASVAADAKLATITAAADGLWASAMTWQGNPNLGYWRKRDLRWTRRFASDRAYRAAVAADATNVFAFDSAARVTRWDGTSTRTSPLPITLPILAAWASSKNDVWGGTEDGSLVHFNGATWTAFSTSFSPGSAIFSFSGTGRNDVWAVGDAGTISHFNGSTWATVSIASSDTFYTVWASGPSDVWAAGRLGTMWHWDGNSWSSVPTGTTNISISTIWGSAPNDVWAGGDFGLLLHWDGEGWQQVQSGESAPGASINGIQRITGTGANDVWATTGDKILHFDGQRWSRFGSVDREYMGITSAGGSGVWAYTSAGVLAQLRTTP